MDEETTICVRCHLPWAFHASLAVGQPCRMDMRRLIEALLGEIDAHVLDHTYATSKRTLRELREISYVALQQFERQERS